jgi:4-amino-4-deoxy-L-arabinose transferase-like glycosyltransferase
MNPGHSQVGGRRTDGRTAGFIVAIALLGLVLRLAFGLGYWVGKPIMKDEEEYLLLATRVATGQGFNYPPPLPGQLERHFERPPVFAFFLATVLRLTDGQAAAAPSPGSAPLPRSSSDVPRSLKVAQALVGTLGILLIAGLAGRAGGPAAAVAAATMAAVYPPLVWSCAYVLSEPLYSALALATVWLLQKAGDAAGRSQLVAGFGAGLLAGSALLTKEAMLFFLPLAGLWLIFRRQYALALVLTAGVAAIAVPWIVRNYVVHDRFVLTAAHGGVTLWTGNNTLAIGEGDLAANPEMSTARADFEDSHPGLTNQELDGLYYREVFNFVTGHTRDWLVLGVRKFFYTFVPIGPSYRLHSRRYYLTSLVSYVALMSAAVVGLWLLVARGRPSLLWALGLLFVSNVMVCLVFFPQERFRVPVADPAAIVTAALCWGHRRPT